MVFTIYRIIFIGPVPIKGRKFVVIGSCYLEHQNRLEAHLLEALNSINVLDTASGKSFDAKKSKSRDTEWIFVNEFGDSKTYIHEPSIQMNGSKLVAKLVYVLDPPGTDKRNNRPFNSMLMTEEYNISNGKFRLHEILFAYTDGERSEPLAIEPTWNTATEGNLKTLQFLKNYASKSTEDQKSKWWQLWKK